MKCPACNEEDAGEGNFCIHCGARLPGDSLTSQAEPPPNLAPFRLADLGQQLLEAARRYLTSSVAICNGPLRDRLEQAIQDGQGQMATFAD